MPSDASNEIQQKIDALPPEIKDFIYSPDMNQLVQQIGAKNQLHIDQIGALESEIVAAMIGISPLKELSENIADTLSIDKLHSDQVVKDINDLILNKVRSNMMRSDIKAAEAPKAPSVPPAITNTPVAPAAAPAGEKSVVMPSAIKASAAPSAPIADIKPPVTAPASTPAVGPISNPVSLPVEATAKSGAPATDAKLGNHVTIPVAPTQTPAPTKPGMPPVIATVAPTTPVAPKVDEVLLKPTISAAPKLAEAAPAVTPAPVTPQTPAAPATPPPPPEAHAVDPYREPID